MLPCVCWHSRQSTYIERKCLKLTLYISSSHSGLKIVNIFEWKLFVSSKINSIPISGIIFLYAKYVQFFSFPWINFLFPCVLFEFYLAPYPDLGKWWKQQWNKAHLVKDQAYWKTPLFTSRGKNWKLNIVSLTPWGNQLSCSLELEVTLILSVSILDSSGKPDGGNFSSSYFPYLTGIISGVLCLMASPVLEDA